MKEITISELKTIIKELDNNTILNIKISNEENYGRN